ncbi:mfs multidrug transporter [Diplodia corticola]|uniref:Mfs multidrug transporter n=1 Tax=Diplodia corticola TaxID=236234 RepID=A0A1J9RX57_9PEZI|nr:mfs multidrug transporter [Diplodia corticola]OJD32927.1 mfs multidrug transporter [Diplodia corticola]
MSVPHSEVASMKSGMSKDDAPSMEDVPIEPSKQSPPEQPAFNPNWRFYVAFCSLSVITLMAALDATSISVALSIMAKLLKGSAIEAFWAGTSFLLTCTVFQPVLGSFSDVFGRKPIIFLSLALFGAGAIVSAVANNFTVILVGRSIQGIGGGGIIVLTEIVVTDLVPLRERGKWFSLISANWALGTVFGPLLGGGFAEKVSWRWIFWINLPFIAVGVPLVAFFLTLHFKPTSLLHKLARIDWPGVVVFVAATTGLLIPITWGGVQYAWSSWRTLVPLLVCAAALVGFVVYEDRYAANPLIQTRVFKNRTAASTFAQTVLHGLVLWSELYYAPLYYEAVKGYSPVLAGVALFPQTFTVAPAAMAVGFLIAHTGRYRWALWSGWLLTTLGLGLLVYLDVDTPASSWIPLNLVPGVGTGILFPSMGMAVQAASAARDQAAAVTMFAFLRALGQTLGVAIGGVVFQNQIRQRLLRFPLLASSAESLSRDASGLVEVIKSMDDADPAKGQLKEAYVYGLRRVWVVMCALAAVALVASFFVEGLPLDQALATEQGFRNEGHEGVGGVEDEEKRGERGGRGETVAPSSAGGRV